MSKLILSLILIGGGIALIVYGTRRADSVTGIADEVGAKLANTWDGQARQPDHIWYYVGGGVLVLAGVVVALRKSPGA
jgi:Protein of unknown function (DUF3185)